VVDRVVDVVIVAYRNGDALVRALDALATEPLVRSIAVVDHGDGTDAAAAAARGAAVHHDPANPGFGAGQNAGVARTTAPYVVLLNPDAELTPGALAAGVAMLEDRPEVAAVQGVIVGRRTGRPERSQGDAPGPVQLLGRALRLKALLALAPVRALARRVPAVRDDVERVPLTTSDLDNLAATAPLVRRAAYDDVGGFDERFFLYGEDLDLCRRWRRAGWALVALPTPWAVHDEGASSASGWEREIQWWRGTMRNAARWWPTGAWRLGLLAAILRSATLAVRRPRRARQAWRAMVAEPRADRRAGTEPWTAGHARAGRQLAA
jgi:GT2 family glycosyltransferase